MRDIPRDIENAFYKGTRTNEVPFVNDDCVDIVAGANAGLRGAVIALETLYPTATFHIEVGNDGRDIVASASELRLHETTVGPVIERHLKLIRDAIPLWHATMGWAKDLLVRAYNLNDPLEILPIGRAGEREKQVPGTSWFFYTHGAGVSIYKSPFVGGIDFDFDKPDPDPWRLKDFIERQIADGQLPYEQYRDFENDGKLFERAIREVLAGA